MDESSGIEVESSAGGQPGISVTFSGEEVASLVSNGTGIGNANTMPSSGSALLQHTGHTCSSLDGKEVTTAVGTSATLVQGNLHETPSKSVLKGIFTTAFCRNSIL
jgi:hypothetical protein